MNRITALSQAYKKPFLILATIAVCAIALPQVWAAGINDVRGYKTGLAVAKQVGAGQDKLGNNLQSSRGFYNGIALGYLLGEEGKITPTFLFDDVEKISEVGALLELDLRSFLDSSRNRSDALDVYLSELGEQNTLATNRVDVLTQQINSLQNTQSALSNQEQQFAVNLANAIDSKFPYESEDNFQKLAAVRNRTGEVTTQLRALQTVSSKYTLATQLLQNKIEFVRANREALIQGVRVVNISDPQIKLILTREEWLSLAR